MVFIQETISACFVGLLASKLIKSSEIKYDAIDVSFSNSNTDARSFNYAFPKKNKYSSLHRIVICHSSRTA